MDKNVRTLGAETGIIREKYVNNVSADAMAPCITMSPTIMIFNYTG